jgi:hypothetical protein
VRRALSFCLLAALAAGCRSEKDPVLARVGKLKITQSEFQRKLGEVSAGYQDYVLTPSGRRQLRRVERGRPPGDSGNSQRYQTRRRRTLRQAERFEHALINSWIVG